MRHQLIIGTRKSPLALWQSEYIRAELQRLFVGIAVELKHVVTAGDKSQDSKAAIPAIGGKGLFTAELEECLLRGEIDLAVHSLKDLPTECAEHFTVGAIPVRSYVEDVLISPSGAKLSELPAGAVVGTSSLRRSSQLVHFRPDLKTAHIRGNVDTRIKKLRAAGGEFDAILLARAGLTRLQLEHEITEVLPLDVMLPAPGQGALGIECRSDDAEILSMLSKLHHLPTAIAVAAERSFLSELGAGCNTPVAAHAVVERRGAADWVVMHGRCLSQDGRESIRVAGEALAEESSGLGKKLAEEAIALGFSRLCAGLAQRAALQ
jgi:hydroxymethylbilane synthase